MARIRGVQEALVTGRIVVALSVALGLQLGGVGFAQAADLQWVAASGGQVPAGAFVAGQEPGRPLVLCRASHNGGVHPGKVVAGNCNIGWGGGEVVLPSFEVLTGDAAGVAWVAAQGGQPVPNAYVGGQEAGRDLVVCRAAFNRGQHPGKVVGANCNVGFGGRELEIASYEVMTIPPAAPVAAAAAPASAPVNSPLSWVKEASGRAPANAVVAGQEGSMRYPLCRATLDGNTYPGMLFGHTCNFALNGREVEGQIYEVLTGDAGRVTWQAARGGKMPAGAFIGGRSGDQDFAVCHAMKEGGVYPGRVTANGCVFPWHAEEQRSMSYEVMVAPPAAAAVAAAPAPAPQAPAGPPPGAIAPQPDRQPPVWTRLQQGRVPPNAIGGGMENNRPLLLCRASHAGGVHPGKLVGADCNIGYGGKEVSVKNAEVLTGNPSRVHWETAPGGKVPGGAFVGGSERGRNLAVCRAPYKGGTHPGKVVGSTCNFGYGGKEVSSAQFEVLVDGPQGGM